jgi:hypothetical protein
MELFYLQINIYGWNYPDWDYGYEWRLRIIMLSSGARRPPEGVCRGFPFGSFRELVTAPPSTTNSNRLTLGLSCFYRAEARAAGTFLRA